jgi:hypothetical protein
MGSVDTVLGNFCETRESFQVMSADAVICRGLVVGPDVACSTGLSINAHVIHTLLIVQCSIDQSWPAVDILHISWQTA